MRDKGCVFRRQSERDCDAEGGREGWRAGLEGGVVEEGWIRAKVSWGRLTIMQHGGILAESYLVNDISFTACCGFQGSMWLHIVYPSQRHHDLLCRHTFLVEVHCLLHAL